MEKKQRLKYGAVVQYIEQPVPYIYTLIFRSLILYLCFAELYKDNQ